MSPKPSLANSAFPPEKRAAAYEMWSRISDHGLSTGPLVGGLIMEGAHSVHLLRDISFLQLQQQLASAAQGSELAAA